MAAGTRSGGEHLQRVILCGSAAVGCVLRLKGGPAVCHELPQNGGAAPRRACPG